MTPWVLLLFPLSLASKVPLIQDEAVAKSFLAQVNAQAQAICTIVMTANWNYDTNITEENAKAKSDVSQKSSAFYQQVAKNASLFDAVNFSDHLVQRQLIKAGWTAQKKNKDLSEAELQELSSIEAEMIRIYGSTQICDYDNSSNCDLYLDPELTDIMATSHDYYKLLYYWREWHEKVGRPMRPLFQRYVELKNKAAQLSGCADEGENWRSAYESETFESDLRHLWQAVRPLYIQLHAYVRRKLREKYGDQIQPDGAIPAHLLGNMWAQHWLGIEPLVRPYPAKNTYNPVPEMIDQNYTGKRMYELANNFFTSMGMKSVPETFWNLSMFERPKDRNVVCHGSAFNLCNGDVRVKICAALSLDELLTAHHEMGHVQYYMQFQHQPYLFQEGANPAFHEAIGDTLTLSASTGSHLHEIGLLPNFDDDDDETSTNGLMQVALKKVAFLPFGFVLDHWRWKVFSGDIMPDHYNEKWWYLRRLYQGVEPAVSRTEEDFDPGAKYHVPAGVAYIRYFVAHILQFQFHQALCKAAGLYDPQNASKPLYKCDISNSTKAGKLFSKMLSMGSSEPWTNALLVITENQTRQMDAKPLLDYFQPLMDFLVRENTKTNEYIGWKDSSATFQGPSVITVAILTYFTCLHSLYNA